MRASFWLLVVLAGVFGIVAVGAKTATPDAPLAPLLILDSVELPADRVGVAFETSPPRNGLPLFKTSNTSATPLLYVISAEATKATPGTMMNGSLDIFVASNLTHVRSLALEPTATTYILTVLPHANDTDRVIVSRTNEYTDVLVEEISAENGTVLQSTTLDVSEVSYAVAVPQENSIFYAHSQDTGFTQFDFLVFIELTSTYSTNLATSQDDAFRWSGTPYVFLTQVVAVDSEEQTQLNYYDTSNEWYGENSVLLSPGQIPQAGSSPVWANYDLIWWALPNNGTAKSAPGVLLFQFDIYLPAKQFEIAGLGLEGQSALAAAQTIFRIEQGYLVTGVANSGDKAALVRLAVGSKAKFDLASVETVELGVSPCDRTFSGAVNEKVFVVAGGCNGELLTIYQAQ